ncbi:hypothetical protein HY383_02200 [Candidatus Daviesbacteria bacterium]|nr:hypothetical protein [Candidatus Daviesbacteria bacterium]
MNKAHIIAIYLALGILALFTFFGNNQNSDLDQIKDRVTKVEFFQEATRVRENIVGFKQVNASLVNDTERAKSCTESKDLLTEWTEDIKKLGLDFGTYMTNHQEAKDYFDTISKLNDVNITECNKLTSK